MIRKQVYIEARQEAQLKRLARTLSLSEAALIRRSLDRGLRLGTMGHRSTHAWAQIKAFIHRRMRKGWLSGKRNWRRAEIDAR
jgi:hypothetical protein